MHSSICRQKSAKRRLCQDLLLQHGTPNKKWLCPPGLHTLPGTLTYREAAAGKGDGFGVGACDGNRLVPELLPFPLCTQLDSISQLPSWTRLGLCILDYELAVKRATPNLAHEILFLLVSLSALVASPEQRIQHRTPGH